MARLFLVTANIGSVFDNLEHGLPVWLNEFASAVRSRDPEFVAIHFQETGGKDCPNTIDATVTFFRQLVECMEQLHFRVAEGFVDTRSDLKDQYTALSSIYFVHESLRLPVHIWDFQDAKFHEVSLTLSSSSTTSSSSFHPNVHMGPTLDQTSRKQKEKFPKQFYPNQKWSRKGILRTRWRFGTTVVDLVNIHLFHDSCNLVAASAFPSPFAQHREKTLKYTLDRILSDGLSKSPLFIFGDFNFRINAFGVMDILRKDFDCPGAESEIILATKKFHCPEQELRFKHSFEWLKQHDFESKNFTGLLQEYDLNFHPTYPFDEEIDKPEKFMRTRLPAWCDRVLFTPSTINAIAKEFPIDYNLIGSKVCMGDHKPVSLLLKIKSDEHPPPTSNMNCSQDSGPTSNNESGIKAPPHAHHVNHVPNGKPKMGKGNKDPDRKCLANGHGPDTPLPPTKPGVVGCPNETCAARLMLMLSNSRNNGSSEIIPIGNSNLGLIALDTDLERKGALEKDCCGEPLNGKIPVCWAASAYNNCPDCCVAMNNKNLQSNHLYHHHEEKSQSGNKANNANNPSTNGLNCRGRSASQCSGTVQAYKTHLKEGMSKTTAAAGDCISCSKCVIL